MVRVKFESVVDNLLIVIFFSVAPFKIRTSSQNLARINARKKARQNWKWMLAMWEKTKIDEEMEQSGLRRV